MDACDAITAAVAELATADSGLRLLESAAAWGARLAGAPCVVVMHGLEGSFHVVASGQDGPVDPSLGRLVTSAATRHRWLPAEALGFPPGDAPMRPAVTFALAANPKAASLGELVLFETAGPTHGTTVGPTTAGAEAAHTIALLAGALLAGGPGGRCACAANTERTRIMAELHDGLLQRLYGVALDIQTNRQLPLPIAARRTLRRWDREISRAIDDTRHYLDTLEAPDAVVPELGAGLDEAAAETAAAGIDAEIDVTVDPSIRLTADARRTLLGIVQEALSNVRRHSHASRVTVCLDITWQRVALRIQDDGVGFCGETARGGHGLQIMEARAADLACAFQVSSEIGRGTRIDVAGPLVPRAASLEYTSDGAGHTCCLSAS